MWSPDGGSLMLALDWEIPLDGSTPRQLPWADRGGAAWENPSPDGSRVAYTTRTSLAVAAADGSDPEEMFGDCPCGSIAWSPNGDRIAFTSEDGTELRLLDVATGTVTLLTATEGSDMLLVLAGTMFEFSPEGDRILFSTTGDWSTSGSSARELALERQRQRRRPPSSRY